MSLSREVLLDLMALADGELEGEAKERTERLAAENVEARQVVLAMRAPEIPTWLAAASAERASAADGIADGVMSRIESGALQDGAPVWAPRARPTSAPARRARTSRRVAIGISAGGLALAAGAALVVRSATQLGSSPAAGLVAPSAETSSPTAVAQHEHTPNARGVVVEEIDSPSRDVSIFQIPAMANASASSSVVVWIEDDPGGSK